jgi:hypothetical protein
MEQKNSISVAYNGLVGAQRAVESIWELLHGLRYSRNDHLCALRLAE